MTNEEKDYRSLEAQFIAETRRATALQVRNRALWLELQAATDTLLLAANQLKKEPVVTPDLLTRLSHDAAHGRALLRGEG